MRPLFRVVRAVVALGGATALLLPVFAARAETTGVQTTAANTFAPATVTINPGDSVLWTNNGGALHTVTSTSPNWQKDSQIYALQMSTSYKFDAPGQYTYQCSTHASSGMKGVVVVRAPRPSPTPTHRPTPTRTGSPAPSTSAPSSSSSPSPSASATSGTPSVTPLPSGSTPPPTLATVVPSGEPSVFLGTGGLTPSPPSGRDKGLPLLLALLLVGGVGSAELRALLANAP